MRRRRAGAGPAPAAVVVAALALAVLAPSPASAAAPPPPAGPHPRIGLSAAVRATLKAQLGTRGSAIAAAVAQCGKAPVAAGTPDGYQGLDWASNANACALAYQVTGDKAHVARGVALWRALLEDVGAIGDGKACKRGVDARRARAAIERDTGYAIRFIGPAAALSYDWLHDAPGVDETLRRQSRDCFRAWIDWYTADGYLNRVPGANYHAGYVVAKTLIAIAVSGEDAGDGAGLPPEAGAGAGAAAPAGPASARFWREVVDDVFGRDIVGNGLAGDNRGYPRGTNHGALVGGDWPEGWQYGPLSVLEYALSARALAEQGVRWPEVAAWVDDLTLRYLHGLTPDGKGTHVGGDTEDEGPFLEPSSAVLMATLIGPGGDRAAGWAAHLRGKLQSERFGLPVFDALADARQVKAADPLASRPAPWFVAQGTRTLYARSAFTPDAYWAVFTSSPRVVPDHQHMDSSGFVFSRGADPLIVDPSPYGSRSTLTGNAMTVDSDVVQGKYKPSQTPWSVADLRWARGTASGVVAARADVAGAFRFSEVPSDVPLARRDWVFLPEGETIAIDRAVTGGPTRKVYLRFRTPAALTLAAAGGHPVARGQVGASALAIHAVVVEPRAAPTIVAVPKSRECADDVGGACTAARFPVHEYALKVTGDEVLAIHVLDGLGRAEAPAEVAALREPGAVGVSIRRAGKQTYVVAAARPQAQPPSRLSYAAAGAGPARHVVFDAPGSDSGAGETAVTALAGPDGRCQVTLSSSGGKSIAGRPAIFVLGPAAGGCVVSEDVAAGQVMVGRAGEMGGPPGLEPRSRRTGGCSYVVERIDNMNPKRKRKASAALVVGASIVVVGLLVARLRRRRRPR